LYEALNRKAEAIKTYQAGMIVSRKANDNHAYSELLSVYNSAMGMDYEDD
jgi:hypothetical protein